MSNHLTLAVPSMTFADVERLANSIAKSNLFGIKTPDQAVVLMMIAQAEGRHPALAARDYDIIQGRPAKKAEAMLRDFGEAGGKVEWHALNDAIADATFSHPQGGSVRISWDMARAATAGLSGKDNWKKFPRQMLRSRTVSEGVRTVWPTATSGMYVPEEAPDTFNGTTIDHEADAGPSDAREAINASVPLADPPAPPPRPATKPKTEYTDEQWRGWLDKTHAALAVLRSRTEVEEVAGRDSVGNAIANGPPWVKKELTALLAEHFARFAEEQEPLEDIAAGALP